MSIKLSCDEVFNYYNLQIIETMQIEPAQKVQKEPSKYHEYLNKAEKSFQEYLCWSGKVNQSEGLDSKTYYACLRQEQKLYGIYLHWNSQLESMQALYQFCVKRAAYAYRDFESKTNIARRYSEMSPERKDHEITAERARKDYLDWNEEALKVLCDGAGTSASAFAEEEAQTLEVNDWLA